MSSDDPSGRPVDSSPILRSSASSRSSASPFSLEPFFLHRPAPLILANQWRPLFSCWPYTTALATQYEWIPSNVCPVLRCIPYFHVYIPLFQVYTPYRGMYPIMRYINPVLRYTPCFHVQMLYFEIYTLCFEVHTLISGIYPYTRYTPRIEVCTPY